MTAYRKSSDFCGSLGTLGTFVYLILSVDSVFWELKIGLYFIFPFAMEKKRAESPTKSTVHVAGKVRLRERK